jgi:small-conductance mechanosensitive channel
VRISGVTGDVIEIGWLQFQLRPVNTETQQPSDELVTFSNSFIFSSPGTGLSRFDRNHLSQAQLDKAAKAAQL